MDEKQPTNKLIPFPQTASTVEVNSEWEERVFRALVAPLRSSAARRDIARTSPRSPEEIEALFRTPRFRGRLLACVEAFVAEQVPLAVARWSQALEDAEPWAFKLILEAVEIERRAGRLVEAQPDHEDVIISSAFEREVVERTLAYLRSRENRLPQVNPTET